MPETSISNEFRQRLENFLQGWENGPPTREVYLNAARELTVWRKERNHTGLWTVPPLMVTATIDDGWGHGLEVIEKLAEAAGIRVHSLGLLQPPVAIIDACRRMKPHFLGMTVLQFDSDDKVAEIVHGLPSFTRLVAGGAAFYHDPDFAVRTGTHVVMKNGALFLQFLIEDNLK
ncbi:MAG: hypothetical protein AB7S77_12300 [Desulfatirhabdiaceae bacterium]